MASNDIKSTHDDNPTGADDVTADYYFQCVKKTLLGVLSDEGVSVAQLRSMLQIEPIANRDIFIMWIPDNSTDAVVEKVAGDYTHWMIVELGDPDPPIYTDTRFNEWPMPTVFSVCSTSACAADDGDWSSRTWYLYVKDTESVYSIPSADGSYGITVTPSDTIGPVWAVGGFAVDSDAAYTITAPTDSGIGLAAAETYDIYVDDALKTAKFTAPTGTIPVVAGTHTAYAIARDESGNAGQSDTVTFTTGAATAGTVSMPTVTQEVAENLGATTTVTLTRTGGTAAFDIDVSTRDLTAESGTNYTAISSETVSFGSGVNEQTFDFEPLNNSEATNKVCNLEIDFDSADVVAGDVEVGTESVLMKITGTAGTGNAGFQMDSNGDYALTVEGEHYDNTLYGGSIRNSIASGQTSDAWSQNPWGNGSRSVNAMNIANTTSVNDYGSASVLDIEAPYVEYQLAIDSTAVSNNGNNGGAGEDNWFDLFVRKMNTNLATTHASLVRTVDTITENAGTVTVTLDRAHGMTTAGSHTVYFEGVTGANEAWYNDTDGHAVASATEGAKTFTITAGSPPGAPGSVTDANCLGADIDLLALDVAPYIVNSGGRWEWENIANNQQTMYINEAGTWYFRFYVREAGDYIDRFTIVPRVTGWDGSITGVNVDVARVPSCCPKNSNDDWGGLDASSYSAGSSTTPEDNENNPEFPYLPLPDATTPSVEC